MTTLLRAVPQRWRTPQGQAMLITRLLIIGVTLALAYFWGRRPSLTYAIYPVVAVGAWLLVLHPHWGIPLLVSGGLVIPFAIGSGGSALNFAFLLVPAITGVWVLSILRRGQLAMVRAGPVWPLIGLVVIVTLSLLIGYLPWNVFAQLAPLRAQLGAWALFVFSILAFVISANLLRDERWLRITVWSFLAVGSGYVMGLWIPPLRFLRAYFSSGAYGSLYWLWLAALAAGQALFNRQLSWRMRVVLGLLALAPLGDRLLPVNRSWVSGWLPCAVALGIVVWLRWPRLGTGLAILAVFGSIVYLPTVRSLLVAGNEYSLTTRGAASSIILEIVQVNPLFGVGPANYYYYTRLYSILGYYVRFNSHNQYIDIIAQTGLLGLFCLAWFFLAISLVGYRLYRRLKGNFSAGYAAACLGGLVGMLAAGMLGDWFIPFVYNVGFGGFRSSVLGWVFLGGLVALDQIVQRRQTDQGAAAEPSRP